MAMHRGSYQLIALIITLFLLICFGSATYAMKSLSDKEMGNVTAKEGMLIDILLDVSVGNTEFTDEDGANCCSGTPGTVQIGGNTALSLSDDGSAADLTGMTVDFDGSTNVGTQLGVGAIVIGLPNGVFDVTNLANAGAGSGNGVNVFLGSTASGGGNAVGGFRLEDINMSGTRIEVSTNPP